MTKRALCIGINNFKNFPENSLNGCINDAYDMHDLMVKYMGFKDNDIVKLLDKEATKKNIMNNLQEMVKGACKGKYDTLVFSMSSHGTQQSDASGDEADKRDEAFCPYDLAVSGSAWDRDSIITDDELHDLFIQLPDDVNLEVYLDTCHSGTGLKIMESLHERQPRYIKLPSNDRIPEIDISIHTPSTLGQIGDNHTLWAACRADQTSADARINNEWHGAFTYYFSKQVNLSENKLSREDILRKVSEDLKSNGYDQEPQLECNATKRDKSL